MEELPQLKVVCIRVMGCRAILQFELLASCFRTEPSFLATKVCGILY